MKSNLVKPHTNRHAFTLIELIVVLTILVGLAGILIPAVTNMIGRTSRSSSAVNIAEISSAIQRYEAIYLSYPNNFDSLMQDLIGTDLNTLSSGLGATTPDVQLDADTLATLSAAGITAVGVHDEDDATFHVPTITALTDTTYLKGLSTAKQQALGLETTGVLGKYVVLGIGSKCTLNGKTMIDAPVHFPRDTTSNPEEMYSRFLAIFQITDGTDALARARFVGVMSPDGSSMNTELGGYYTITSND
jgi:prepilin-type N-terminal cleavage/methylation domain-containing protein